MLVSLQNSVDYAPNERQLNRVVETYREKYITGTNVVLSVNARVLNVTRQSTSSMELLSMFTDPLISHCNSKTNNKLYSL